MRWQIVIGNPHNHRSAAGCSLCIMSGLLAPRAATQMPPLRDMLQMQAAVKILWESCIKPLDFPRSVDACLAVLRRVQDPEESIQDSVTKTFHSLWFAHPHTGEPCVSRFRSI